jgi:HSP20 family protein
MTMPLIKKGRRPVWMTPFGEEGWGDVFMDRLWREWPRWKGEEWVPTFNFYEKEGKYFLTAEIPGVEKNDLAISIDHNVLTISGRKETKKEEEGANYYLRESSYGSFSRSLRLPGDVQEEKVEASFKDGVLSVVIPQAETPKTKKIEIKS